MRDAALRAFGRYGYAKTSAEQVARAAAIAKGMVFHYFGSKRGLFEYLTGYCMTCFEQWFGGLEGKLAGLDFIEQYRLITRLKVEVYAREPHVVDFFTMLFMFPENLEVSGEVKALYQRGIAMRTKALAFIQGGGDASPFKEGLSPEKGRQYVRWLLDGYAQQLLARLARQPLADIDLDPYWAEFDEILDDMKKLFYSK